jgi:hypothetical protein
MNASFSYLLKPIAEGQRAPNAIRIAPKRIKVRLDGSGTDAVVRVPPAINLSGVVESHDGLAQTPSFPDK